MWRLFFCFIGVALSNVAFSTGLAANLEKPRVASYAGYTRLVFDVPNEAPFKTETLGSILKVTLSNNNVVASTVNVNKPELRAYSLAKSGSDVIAMLVTPQGVSSRRGFRVQRLEPSAGKTGFRLVIDFSGAFSDVSPLPAVPALKLQKAKGKPFTVVLDPGHGGNDPGALGNGLLESNLNLDVAFRIKKWLLGSGINVEMTRVDNRVFSSNKRSDLNARAEASKGKTAFVSIHANARERNLWNSTFGMEVYYFDSQRQKPLFVSPAPAPKAEIIPDVPLPQFSEPELKPAETNIALLPSSLETPFTPNANGFGTWQELEPINNPVPDVSIPLLAPLMNRTVASRELATGVLSQMLGATGAFNRGVQVGDYFVIRNAECPAILVEMGFVTHPVEAAQFKNSHYLDRMSYSIARGILEYVEGLVLPSDALIAPFESRQ
jgi:N-acetylmuramoyl-L-alanine amidase